MSDSKRKLYFSYDESSGCWNLNVDQSTYDMDGIKKKLADYYPFADFDKRLKKARRNKSHIIIDNDNIVIGETRKVAINTLIPENFQMLFCYIPQESCILLHKSQPIDIKQDPIDELIKRHLIPDFVRSNEDSFHIISWNGSPSNFKEETKSYLSWRETKSIRFNSKQKLETGIKEELANYSQLSDISPFFKTDVSVDDLINRVKGSFDIDKKSSNSDRVPTLSIELTSIKYLAANGHKENWGNFNRYNSEDSIFKELKTLFRSVQKYRDNPPSSPNSQSQYVEKHISTNIDTKTPSKAIDTLSSKQELADNELQELVSNRLQNTKYCTHLKQLESSDENAKFSLTIAGGHKIDSEIEKFLNKRLSFNELIEELEQCFFPIKRGYLFNAIAEHSITQQLNLNFSLSDSEESRSWEVKVSGGFSKKDNERKLDEIKKKEKEVKEREEKIKEQERKIKSQERAHKVLQNMVSHLRRKLEIDEDTDILKHVEELKRSSTRAELKHNELKLVTDILDEDQSSLRKKLESLESCLSTITPEPLNLAKLDASEFVDLLHKLKDSYKKLESLNSLKDYDGADLKAFSVIFGDIRSYVQEVIDRSEKSVATIDKIFVISDAIRSRLSNPEVRKIKLPSPQDVNQELKRYGLQIFIPNLDAPAEPARHKVVDYETGGVRGTISSIVSWGVLEIGKDGSPDTTIFKSEVKIYQ